MSRVGKAPITIPAGVELKVDDKNVVTAKGPKGELTQKIDVDMKISINDGVLEIARPSEQKRHKALHGLSRALINNMVVGVSEGYKTQQELVGVGYRAAVQGQVLDLTLGYSHHIYMEIPAEVKVSTDQEKGKNPVVTLESPDKQLIGQVAAKIRGLRKPEPYKGKGIKFVGEQLRRKAGKAASK